LSVAEADNSLVLEDEIGRKDVFGKRVHQVHRALVALLRQGTTSCWKERSVHTFKRVDDELWHRGRGIGGFDIPVSIALQTDRAR
jgi:hypothetical protein